MEEGETDFADVLDTFAGSAVRDFGNMLLMAVASLYLLFLGMLATQFLLNNLLYDVSGIEHTLDNVHT